MKRTKRKIDDDNTPTPSYRTKMARSNSAAPNSTISGSTSALRDKADRDSNNDRGGASSVASSVGPSADRDRDDAPRSGRNGKKGGPDPSNLGNESLLTLKSEVAYRLPKQKGGGQEGEFIQCIIIDITGEGGKRRYTIQDPEPDEAGSTHGQVYKAQASSLIPIPKDSAGLSAYPVGKQVLAMYPETTMFYRAEVMGTKRDGTCRLKFEGEEEVGKETEVERRLVLDVGGR